jgi:cell division protein FtsI (penicillin-binding protein 3)
VVLVSIDEPKGAYYGGVIAAPAFKEIVRSSLIKLGVPPDKGDAVIREDA